MAGVGRPLRCGGPAPRVDTMEPALVLAPTPAKMRPGTAWVSVDPALQTRFKTACQQHGVSMHDQAELLIEAWLQGDILAE